MTPTDETRALVDEINALVETGTEEIERLRARVAELEEENEQLRWARRASCVRTPTPGCECPGCETARERAAQVDIVESYEAELEEDRQAERDRILGARVREIARQHDARQCAVREIERLRARVAELEHEHDLSTSEGIRARIRELEAEVDVLTSELEVVEEAEAEEVPGG